MVGPVAAAADIVVAAALELVDVLVVPIAVAAALKLVAVEGGAVGRELGPGIEEVGDAV